MGEPRGIGTRPALDFPFFGFLGFPPLIFKFGSACFSSVEYTQVCFLAPVRSRKVMFLHNSNSKGNDFNLGQFCTNIARIDFIPWTVPGMSFSVGFPPIYNSSRLCNWPIPVGKLGILLFANEASRNFEADPSSCGNDVSLFLYANKYSKFFMLAKNEGGIMEI